MITLPGHLAIRTISGRHGYFNVGRLSTSIGEFVIKDALLEQYTEGKYRGDFAVIEIRPSYYVTGGRLVVEVRARLDSMVLDDVENLSSEDTSHIDAQIPDPVDDDNPTSYSRPHKAPRSKSAVSQPDDLPPFGMPVAKPAQPCVNDADAELFGSVWPLGHAVKLDSTVDRQQLRNQCQRLSQMGYELDFRLQTWYRSPT
ncbi:DUF3275 family protein [Pseudomonas cichorii]|uniref:DUF3275 family protein n=1 Tax=Pseudomonas cichorii TaxID=36746 RepID=UPI0018E5C268|nr:DUF3275 family protein [Pseudomonas cichorii]MBI6855909.1 DUF3275 family protein [Pseudomonas cichorii]